MEKDMDEEGRKNYYPGMGLVFGVIVAVNAWIIFDLPVWVIGIGAGFGLVAGAIYAESKASRRSDPNR